MPREVESLPSDMLVSRAIAQVVALASDPGRLPATEPTRGFP